MKLSESAVGKKLKVIQVEADGPLKKRLLDMGLIPGCSLEITRAAPLGDPIEIRIRGYDLSLRKAEAESVTVE